MKYYNYYHSQVDMQFIGNMYGYYNGEEFMWWPIGSKSIHLERGVLFASDYPESIRITSYFGLRKQPIVGASINHQAIDIGGPTSGTKEGMINIISSLGGIVIKVVQEDLLGNAVFIRHHGGLETIYSHLSTIFVHKGETVKRGQVIGKMGNTGVCTGTHLDFQVKLNGVNVNPLFYVSYLYPRLP